MLVVMATMQGPEAEPGRGLGLCGEDGSQGYMDQRRETLTSVSLCGEEADPYEAGEESMAVQAQEEPRECSGAVVQA